MGKRSCSSDYESIAKKMCKLQRKLKHARRKETRKSSTSSDSSSSSSSSSSSDSAVDEFSAQDNNNLSQPLCIEDMPRPRIAPTATVSEVQDTGPAPQPSSSTTAPQQSTSAAEPQATTSMAEPQSCTGFNEQPDLTNLGLDPELLNILGEDPTLKKNYGEDIHSELSTRLTHVVCSGLDKEVRKDLLDKYLTPANCKLIDAPTLNPEVKAGTPDTVLKRDKNIEYKQRQLSSAATCVATALTSLLTAEIKNTNLIQILMDAAKLICDAQHMDSITRRNFILNGVKPEMKSQLQATKIGEYLFGDNLTETLKAAKAIIKSGSEMKSVPSQPKNNAKIPQKNLNWRGPPQNIMNRPKGNLRTKRPAYFNKGRHDNFSPQSSRQPQTRPSDNRNRR